MKFLLISSSQRSKVIEFLVVNENWWSFAQLNCRSKSQSFFFYISTQIWCWHNFYLRSPVVWSTLLFYRKCPRRIHKPHNVLFLRIRHILILALYGTRVCVQPMRNLTSTKYTFNLKLSSQNKCGCVSFPTKCSHSVLCCGVEIVCVMIIMYI